MLPSNQPEDFVPHKGNMCLLTRILDAGDDWLQAEVDIVRTSLFATDIGIPAWVGLEYLAQAVAAWSGYQARLQGGSPQIGFLVGTRRYTSSQPYFKLGSTLKLHVRQEMVAENGLHVFACELQGDQVQAGAHINVFQPDNIEAFLQET